MSRRQRTNSVFWLAAGLGAGLAVGWLTAPRRGDWLRNQMRQKLEHWRRVGRRRLTHINRDLENRVRGKAAEVREAWDGHDHYVDANTLVDQVHSQIGREFAPELEHVNLNGVGHTIYLHGHVADDATRDRLVRAIAAVEGVEEVRDDTLRVGPIEPSSLAEGEIETPAKPRRRRVNPEASA